MNGLALAWYVFTGMVCPGGRVSFLRGGRWPFLDPCLPWSFLRYRRCCKEPGRVVDWIVPGMTGTCCKGLCTPSQALSCILVQGRQHLRSTFLAMCYIYHTTTMSTTIRPPGMVSASRREIYEHDQATPGSSTRETGLIVFVYRRLCF